MEKVADFVSEGLGVKVKAEVFKYNKMTLAKITYAGMPNIKHYGWAWCSDSDTYKLKLGMKVALDKALDSGGWPVTSKVRHELEDQIQGFKLPPSNFGEQSRAARDAIALGNELKKAFEGIIGDSLIVSYGGYPETISQEIVKQLKSREEARGIQDSFKWGWHSFADTSPFNKINGDIWLMSSLEPSKTHTVELLTANGETYVGWHSKLGKFHRGIFGRNTVQTGDLSNNFELQSKAIGWRFPQTPWRTDPIFENTKPGNLLEIVYNTHPIIKTGRIVKAARDCGGGEKIWTDDLRIPGDLDVDKTKDIIAWRLR
jgi:hypothetical protein